MITILRGTMSGNGKKFGQRKRWEGSIEECTGMDFVCNIWEAEGGA